VVIADSGYWHNEQMDALAADGIAVLIPPDSTKRKSARPGWSGGRYACIRRLLATDAGRELCDTRHKVIEPVFGQIKFNRRIDRFLRQAWPALSEWRLATATHDLLKLDQQRIAIAGRRSGGERQPVSRDNLTPIGGSAEPARPVQGLSRQPPIEPETRRPR
jgi:hypothetical protein